jgi:hypothetical protein
MGVESFSSVIKEGFLHNHYYLASLSLSLLSIYKQSTFKEAAYPHDTSTVDS